MTNPIDVRVDNCGSIILLAPLTEAAEEWFDDNVGRDNGYQPYWPTVLVEPRYVQDIVEGLVRDGLEVTLG